MEGTSYSELIAEAKRTGVKSIMKFCPPGAETVEQLLGRTKDFFCDICKYVTVIDIDHFKIWVQCVSLNPEGRSLGNECLYSMYIFISDVLA